MPSVLRGNFLRKSAGQFGGLHLQRFDLRLFLAALRDLRLENARLRTALAEQEQPGGEASIGDPALAERMKEFEALLEEKSEVIRELHRKLQEHHDRPAGATPREEELLALSEELERERQQLKEDEESLMQQMRDMEVQMSRERAEMARQRSELQRL